MSSTARRDDPSPGPAAAGAASSGAGAPDGSGATAAGADAPPAISRDQTAAVMAHIRELHERDVRPDEGLRERKKRLSRQLISDTATWMFIERGFDQVRVSEVAAEAGVSEKTVFNYFPTKESLVFDREDDLIEGIRTALTDRGPGQSPTQAMVAFIERECRHIDDLEAEFQPMILAFIRMIDETPALQAARQRSSARMIAVARDALAESVGVDPRDPEPYVAAQALMGLWEVQMLSRERHIRAGIPIGQLRETVIEDTRRAARLLDTGLWSFNQVAQGASARSQVADAAKAAGDAGKQVFEALRQARSAWGELRGRHDDPGRPQRR